MLDLVEIWTDGAARDNQTPELRRSAYSYIIKRTGRPIIEHSEIYEVGPLGTNNRAELIAVQKAFEQIKDPVYIKLYTDSQYAEQLVLHGLEKEAIGFKTSTGKPMKNIDLLPKFVKQIDRLLYIGCDLDVIKVTGHTGDTMNERADLLCNMTLDNYKICKENNIMEFHFKKTEHAEGFIYGVSSRIANIDDKTGGKTPIEIVDINVNMNNAPARLEYWANSIKPEDFENLKRLQRGMNFEGEVTAPKIETYKGYRNVVYRNQRNLSFGYKTTAKVEHTTAEAEVAPAMTAATVPVVYDTETPW